MISGALTQEVIRAAKDVIIRGLEECSSEHGLTLELIREYDCIEQITEDALEAACEVMLKIRNMT